ncbi:MAG: polyprenyl synthetase family protein [Pseudohongiellaceae bacterium]
MYEEIRSVVATDFEAVNRYIVSQLHSDVPLVENIGHYIVAAGGKRMRPVLVLLSARACGIQTNQHVQLATVIEFIHTATLLHDDVVDMSTMRRGRPTANSQWNNPSSVLVGDFIYSRAFQILVGLQNMPIMRIIADTTNKIAEGEVLQLLNKHNVDISETDYLNVIRDKTAILFQAASQCGAILAQADDVTEAAFKAFGMHIGKAFQLIDDVLDYAGDASELGKNVGDDLAEGKPTLPLIYAMHNASDTDARLIRNSLKTNGIDSLEKIIAIVNKSGAIDYTRQLAKTEIDAARICLDPLEDSPFKNALLSMAEMSINRKN